MFWCLKSNHNSRNSPCTYREQVTLYFCNSDECIAVSVCRHHVRSLRWLSGLSASAQTPLWIVSHDGRVSSWHFNLSFVSLDKKVNKLTRRVKRYSVQIQGKQLILYSQFKCQFSTHHHRCAILFSLSVQENNHMSQSTWMMLWSI